MSTGIGANTPINIHQVNVMVPAVAFAGYTAGWPDHVDGYVVVSNSQGIFAKHIQLMAERSHRAIRGAQTLGGYRGGPLHPQNPGLLAARQRHRGPRSNGRKS